MLRSLSFRSLGAAFLVLSMVADANGQNDPAQAAKDLAAFQAFSALVTSRSYEVVEDQLTGMVKKYLQEEPTNIPKTAPTVGDLRSSLDVDFQAWYDELLVNATSDLEADGKTEVKKRLQAFLGKNAGLEDKVKSRHQTYVKEQLPNALAKVNQAILEEQVAALEESLVAQLTEGKPTTAEIEEAYQKGNEAEIADALVRVSLPTGDSEKPQMSLLVDAHEAFRLTARQVVSDGVRQLTDQVDALKIAPQSHTPEGIGEELAVRLDNVAKQQLRVQQSERLGRQYGIFPLAEEGIAADTQEHFDQRVASATGQLQDAVRGVAWRFPEEDGEELRSEMLSDVPAHHADAQSLTLLKPVIDNLVGRNQGHIAEELTATARGKPSEYDTDASLGRLETDITSLFAREDGEAHKSWVALEAILSGKYSGTLVPKVRAAIAEDQAGQYAPSLAAGEWLPNEEEILRFSSTMRQQDLREIDVWREPPPTTTGVFVEVWRDWLDSAKKAVETGQSAMRGQEAVVDTLKRTMEAQVRNDPTKPAEHWVTEYTASVSEAWLRKTGSATKAYPQLFFATKEKIAGIIAMLFQEIAQEKAAEEAEKAAVPEQEPDVLPTPQIDKPEGMGPSVTGNSPRTDESQEEGSSASGDGDGSLDPEEAVLVAQNQIIDSLEPGITEGIKSALETRERIDQEYWTEQFITQAETQWRMHSLAPEFPDLLPSILQRIDGLVADSLSLNASIDVKSRPEGQGEYDSSGNEEDGRFGEGRGDFPLNGRDLNLAEGGDGPGEVDSSYEFYFEFYRFGFWVMLFLLLVMAVSWYWNVRNLRRYIAAHKRPGEGIAPDTSRWLKPTR